MVQTTERVQLITNPWEKIGVTLERVRLLVLHLRQEELVPSGSVVLPDLELVLEPATDTSIA